MKHIKKVNEFISSSKLKGIINLIEEAESTPSGNPEKIASSSEYRAIVNIGEEVVPILIERNKYIWNIALKEITGVNPVGESSSEIKEFWKKWIQEKK